MRLAALSILLTLLYHFYPGSSILSIKLSVLLSFHLFSFYISSILFSTSCCSSLTILIYSTLNLVLSLLSFYVLSLPSGFLICYLKVFKTNCSSASILSLSRYSLNNLALVPSRVFNFMKFEWRFFV